MRKKKKIAIDNKTHWSSVDLSDSVQTKSFLSRKETRRKKKAHEKEITFLLLKLKRIKM